MRQDVISVSARQVLNQTGMTRNDVIEGSCDDGDHISHRNQK